MEYDTIIFDLDGTLIDTLDDLRDSVNYALLAFGSPIRSREEIREFVGNGISDLIYRSVPEGTGEKTAAEVLSVFKGHYSGNLKNKTAPYPGIIELLKKLREAGIKTAVVSNKFDEGVRELCEHFFPGLIDAVAGESESVKKKPAPDSVFAVLSLLSSKPENTVYVGDSDIDIKTAANAKTRFVGVSWGFRGSLYLKKYGADTVIETPEELLELLGL